MSGVFIAGRLILELNCGCRCWACSVSISLYLPAQQAKKDLTGRNEAQVETPVAGVCQSITWLPISLGSSRFLRSQRFSALPRQDSTRKCSHYYYYCLWLVVVDLGKKEELWLGERLLGGVEPPLAPTAVRNRSRPGEGLSLGRTQDEQDPPVLRGRGRRRLLQGEGQRGPHSAGGSRKAAGDRGIAHQETGISGGEDPERAGPG